MQWLKSRVVKNREYNEFSEDISTEEMENAEKLWLRTVQNKLKEEKNIRSLQEQLGLFEDTDQVIRCKGRIKNAELNYETRFLAILPGESAITGLIGRKAHSDFYHYGVKATLNEARS